jgi:2-polyprenyl-3-methyl-5-hydroxy-6-metoxy-1,4-benzoquinol methylase
VQSGTGVGAPPEFTIEQFAESALKKVNHSGWEEDSGLRRRQGFATSGSDELRRHAVGIEQSATARDSIRREGFASAYTTLDDLHQENPQSQFDLIFMIDVVEHLRRPWLDLTRIGQLLAPHGRLVITTMNTNSLRARLSGETWRERVNPTHLFYFTPDSLSRVLRGAGFRTVHEFTPVTNYRHHGPLRRCFQG